MSVGRPANGSEIGERLDLGIEGLSDYTRIGTGGFATVYSALEANAGRRVAVKVLTAVDDSGRRRFDRECLTMGTAGEHQHVVTLLRAGYLHTTGQPYLVMEYMAGGSLAHRLTTEGPIPWPEAIEAALAIAAALGFTHGRGILHKDVKPGNILVSGAGTVKLTDFGIAAIREASGTSQLAYSIHYTAPEIFGGTADPDAELIIDPRDERSDLYSLAAALYTVGMGRPPFQGTTHVALMRQILLDPVPPTGIPLLDQFFARTLAKEADHRPPSAADLATELHHLRAAVDPTTTPAGSWAPQPLLSPTGTAIGPGRANGNATVRVGSPAATPTSLAGVTALGGTTPLPGSAATGPEPLAGPATHSAGPDAPLTALGAPSGPSRPRRRWPLPAAAVFAAGAVAAGALVAVRLAGRDDGPAPVVFAGHRQRATDSNDDAVFDVAELANGRLASVSADGTVLVWDPTQPDDPGDLYSAYRDLVADLSADTLYAVTPLAGGRLALGGADGTVQLWDPAKPGEPAEKYTNHRDGAADPANDDVYAVIQLADGRVASAGDDGRVAIWDPAEPDSTQPSYDRHHEEAASDEGDAVWSLAELPDGRIASGSADGTVHLWDPDEAQSTAVVYRGHTEAAADPADDVVRAIVTLTDGRIASGGADGTVRIWDPTQPGATLATFDGHAIRAADPGLDTVRAMIRLGDGRIASGGMDGAVLVWDPTRPEAPPAVYTGHTEQINGLLELADGRVASSSDDGTVRLWDPARLETETPA